ncbi:hypothetical protein BH10ACT11_BH10ACT11_20920 [soil metagenome]
MAYEVIGRIVVKFAWLKFGRQIKIAGGVSAVLIAGGVYLLSRKSPPEG